MCIISHKVNSVAKTNIFVSLNKSNNRQLVVYSNMVNTPNNNTMIMAVPYPTSIKFHDLSNYTKLFIDLKNSFQPLLFKQKKSRTPSFSTNTESIKVHDVGSYQASIVESLDDIKNLDPTVFQTNDEVTKFLTEKYSEQKNIGFVFCKLKAGDVTYHPFGYSHDALKIGYLFVPTMHYHINENLLFNKETDNDIADDWDHAIYIADGYTPCNKAEDINKYIPENNIKWNKIRDSDFDIYDVENMNVYNLKGKYLNTDLMFYSNRVKQEIEIPHYPQFPFV